MLCGVSVTKLRQGKVNDDQIAQANTSITLIQEHAPDPEEWLNAALTLDGVPTSLTVLKLIPRGLRLQAYLDDPLAEVTRVYPHWRTMFSRSTGSLDSLRYGNRQGAS